MRKWTPPPQEDWYQIECRAHKPYYRMPAMKETEAKQRVADWESRGECKGPHVLILTSGKPLVMSKENAKRKETGTGGYGMAGK